MFFYSVYKMRITTIRNKILMVLILLGMFVSGCSDRNILPDENKNLAKIPLTDHQAIELAVKSLIAKGWNPERYDMSVKETDEEWIVSFIGKSPRPPGDEATVYISKKDGVARFMQGE